MGVVKGGIVVVLGWVTAVLIFLIVGGIGAMKFTGNKDALEQAERLGYRRVMIPIGILEILGVIAIVLGVAVSDLEWLGRLAAFGILGLMLGATVIHHRARDTVGRVPSLVVIALTIGYLIALGG